MKQRAKIVAATGLVASMLPLAGGPADAVPVRTATADFGGYTAEAVATPLRIEVFEPVIPLPASPQAELWFGYSKIVADSSSSSGRSSWLWPGSAVGEGLRVFGEQFGLPADNPLTGPGYTVQVNSQYPGDPTSAKDEPAPGMVMRTTSGDKKARAETGFSPDGTVLGPEAGDAPHKSDNPLLGLQQQLSGLLGGLGATPGSGTSTTRTSTEKTTTEAAADTPSAPPGLGGLEALIDVDGYESVSKMDATEGPVLSASRAELGAVRLLGGLVTLGGFESVAKATTDGATGEAKARATWGKLTVAGQEFSMGPDGAVAVGKPAPVPGLDKLPAAALKQLGITIEAPKPTRKVDGDQVTSVAEGLRVTIDLGVLAPVISKLPMDQLGAMLPDLPGQANALKSLITALPQLKPKVVATFGYARATADTVPSISPVSPAAGADPGSSADAAAGGGATGAGAAGGAAATAPGGADAAPADGSGAAGDASSAAGDLPAATQSSGLPKLATIPGMLLIAAFAGAAVAGSWFRRIGVAALGGGAACSHGLDTGLPDLRKA